MDGVAHEPTTAPFVLNGELRSFVDDARIFSYLVEGKLLSHERPTTCNAKSRSFREFHSLKRSCE
jgi:hypothetical protein